MGSSFADLKLYYAASAHYREGDKSGTHDQIGLSNQVIYWRLVLSKSTLKFDSKYVLHFVGLHSSFLWQNYDRKGLFCNSSWKTRETTKSTTKIQNSRVECPENGAWLPHPQSESQVLGKHPRTAWTLTTRKKVESDTEEVLLHFKLACWAVYINKAMQTKASHCYLDVKNDFWNFDGDSSKTCTCLILEKMSFFS